MRDIVLTIFVFGSLPFILKRPSFGILMYVWLSVMSPHRLAWGFAYNMPFVAVVAATTFAGILFTRDPKKFPFTPVSITLILLFVWMNVTTVFAVDFLGSMVQWNKVMKILLMVFVAMYLLHTKKHILWLVCIVAGSVGYYGIKGGVFTLIGGGVDRVYGPEGSFIEENNSLALATIMTIPLLRFIQLQAPKKWMQWGLIGAQVLCGFSALGSLSRGALLAIAVMLSFFWLKSRKKLLMGALMIMLVPFAAAYMSDKWEARMRTIETFEQDASALGRINSWWMHFNLAKDRPLTGGGFDIIIPEMFARYAPDPTNVKAAHSIYFGMVGEHGFVGLGLFLLLWFLTWRNANWIQQNVKNREGWQWAADLAGMIQVSLVGYLTAGMFLNLQYYDVPYYLVAALVLTRVFLEKEVKENPVQPAGWRVPARAGPAMSQSRANPVPVVRGSANRMGR